MASNEFIHIDQEPGKLEIKIGTGDTQSESGIALDAGFFVAALLDVINKSFPIAHVGKARVTGITVVINHLGDEGTEEVGKIPEQLRTLDKFDSLALWVAKASYELQLPKSRAVFELLSSKIQNVSEDLFQITKGELVSEINKHTPKTAKGEGAQIWNALFHNQPAASLKSLLLQSHCDITSSGRGIGQTRVEYLIKGIAVCINSRLSNIAQSAAT